MAAGSKPRSWERFSGTVLVVVGLHVFIYFATVACVIIPWLSFSVPGIGHLAALSALVTASMVCLTSAVVSDPGRVPDDYVADMECQAANVVEVKKKSGAARVCQKCARGKPPRSHHCRVCRTCVLRMDHHCPWLNNCVGHGNYRVFAQFLLYSTCATCHALALLASHAVHLAAAAASDQVVRTGPQSKVVGGVYGARGAAAAAYSLGWGALQVAATGVALPVALGLVGLLVWNGWLLVHNKTTIEYHEGITAQIKAKKSGKCESLHPYDLGICGNLFAICGSGSLLGWLLPLDPSADGHGIIFRTIWDPQDL